MTSEAVKEVPRLLPSGWDARCLQCNAGMDEGQRSCVRCYAPAIKGEGDDAMEIELEHSEDCKCDDCADKKGVNEVEAPPVPHGAVEPPPIQPGKRIEYISLESSHDVSPNIEKLEGERKEEYEKGKFFYFGIRSIAEIKIPKLGVADWSKKEAYSHQDIKSGGIWSIESDSPKAHKIAMAENTLNELRDLLVELGFEETYAESKCREALKHEDEWLHTPMFDAKEES